MTINQQTLLFFDAASLFLAANNSAGGTGYLLKICQFGFFRALSSPAVLQETERNLASKSSFSAIMTHRQQIADAGVVLVSVPPPGVVAQFTDQFFEDDHVIASALSAKAEFLITNDRPFIRRIVASGHPVIAITPKDFLENYFPTHPDYELIRNSV